MTTGGKGDKPRPYSVPLEQFDNNWDAIFKKKKQEEPVDHKPTDNESGNSNE